MELKSFRGKEKLSTVGGAKVLLNAFRAARKIRRILERRQIVEIERAAVHYLLQHRN